MLVKLDCQFDPYFLISKPTVAEWLPCLFNIYTMLATEDISKHLRS